MDVQDIFRQAAELHRAGDVASAEPLYRQVLAAAPGHFAAQYNLAIALRRLGRPQEALAALDAALALQPSADVHNSRANVLADLGRFDEAVASFDAVLALRPDDAQVLFNRANALLQLGRRDEALASYDAAIAADPAYARAYNNRGAALLAAGRALDAVDSLQTATRLQPGEARAHSNLGEALVRAGRSAEALASFDTALALAPDYAQARWNRSLALLSLGRFEEGWRDYEFRWQTPSDVGGSAGELSPALRARLDLAVVREDLIGRQVLLVAEQGIGDVIMFASMIPDLQRDAGAVTLLCGPRLQRLFAHSFPDMATFAQGKIPPADKVVALGGLGRLYRNRRDAFPGAPYLTASPAVCEAWEARLGPRRGLRVGVSWRGGTQRSRRNERSLDLEQLQPLFDVAGCEFVSLQYGDVRAEVEDFQGARGRLRQFDPADFDDFEDFAGLIQSLDLVVTVQTAAAHLAGAVGVPGLVMLPSAPEWRYAAEPQTIPWYRSLALVRQPVQGDWACVVAEVAARVAALARPPS